MSGELRLAVIAAFALFVSMFLPWYEKNVVVKGRLVNDGLNAFGVFSFVEAAVLLVAVGVIVLCWARAEKKAFHLPGGDGVVLMAAGGWVGLLLVYRLFDKPNVAGEGATVGIQWGIFFALAAAAFLVYTGYRAHQAHRPEPPLPGEASRPARPARPAPAETAQTTPLIRDQRRPATPAGRRIPDRPVSPEHRAAADRAAAPPPALPFDGARDAEEDGDEPTVAMPGRRGTGDVPQPDDPPDPPATLF